MSGSFGMGRAVRYVAGLIVGADVPVSREEPPRSPARFEAHCEWPDCSMFTWAYGEAIWLWHTNPRGGSSVKMTKNGLWACRGHAYAVGGGWL